MWGRGPPVGGRVGGGEWTVATAGGRRRRGPAGEGVAQPLGHGVGERGGLEKGVLEMQFLSSADPGFWPQNNVNATDRRRSAQNR